MAKGKAHSHTPTPSLATFSRLEENTKKESNGKQTERVCVCVCGYYLQQQTKNEPETKQKKIRKRNSGFLSNCNSSNNE